jgi:hypothetical protein
MTPREFGRHIGAQLREKQAIGFGDIGKGLQSAGNLIGETAKGYGHQFNSFYNPMSDAFHAPAGPHASDNIIRNVGRGAAVAAGGAAAALGGIAAAPAITGAANTAGTALAGMGAGVASQAQKAVDSISSAMPRIGSSMQSVQNSANSAMKLYDRAKPWMDATGYDEHSLMSDAGKALSGGGVPDGPYGLVSNAVGTAGDAISNMTQPSLASIASTAKIR